MRFLVTLPQAERRQLTYGGTSRLDAGVASLPCPACAKRIDLGSSDTCIRCGCELVTLRAVVDAAEMLLTRARDGLRQGDWAAARLHAQRSWQLLHAPASARIACLSAAALGDTQSCGIWRRRAEAESCPTPSAECV